MIPQGLNPQWSLVLAARLSDDRRLDKGNPNSGTIGSDFGRFGIAFWDEVYAFNPKGNQCREALDLLLDVRNAIAHQSPPRSKLDIASLRFKMVKAWRRSCQDLAVAFDQIMLVHITTTTGRSPW